MRYAKMVLFIHPVRPVRIFLRRSDNRFKMFGNNSLNSGVFFGTIQLRQTKPINRGIHSVSEKSAWRVKWDRVEGKVIGRWVSLPRGGIVLSSSPRLIKTSLKSVKI